MIITALTDEEKQSVFDWAASGEIRILSMSMLGLAGWCFLVRDTANVEAIDGRKGQATQSKRLSINPGA